MKLTGYHALIVKKPKHVIFTNFFRWPSITMFLVSNIKPIFFTGTSLIMIILSLVELYHLGLGKIWQAYKDRGQDITKEYKTKDDLPTFGGYQGGPYGIGARYPRGYPQAVGIRVGYARSSISGEGGNDFDGDKFI